MKAKNEILDNSILCPLCKSNTAIDLGDIIRCDRCYKTFKKKVLSLIDKFCSEIKGNNTIDIQEWVNEIERARDYKSFISALTSKKKCDSCQAIIHMDDKICSFCQSDL